MSLLERPLPHSDTIEGQKVSENSIPPSTASVVGELAMRSSLLAPRKFIPDKTWLARFRPDRSKDDFAFIPHTFANDILMDYDPHTGIVEVGYRSSALVVDALQGQLDVEKLLKNEGKQPPERRFSFFATDGTFYENKKIIGLPELLHSPTASKHVAVFKDFAIKVDDIYVLTLSNASDDPKVTEIP